MAKETYQDYIKHLESIIQMHEKAPKQNNTGLVYAGDAHGILARAESAISKICNNDSPYTLRMTKILEKASDSEPTKAALLVGIVKALKGELIDGHLQSLPALIRGEMFESLNEMARHLLEEGYKDAAAVIGGTSLESHLQQLAIKNGIATAVTMSDGSVRHKKADQLNQELRKSGAHSLFDQKQITAWLDLRNSAAHGKYSEYNEDQVFRLIEWVDDFISKNPA